MVKYIDKQELIHRLCNGFLSHSGYKINDDGEMEFIDIFKQHGIRLDDPASNNMEFMSLVLQIVDSMPTREFDIFDASNRKALLSRFLTSQEMDYIREVLDFYAGCADMSVTREVETLKKMAEILGVKLDAE